MNLIRVVCDKLVLCRKQIRNTICLAVSPCDPSYTVKQSNISLCMSSKWTEMNTTLVVQAFSSNKFALDQCPVKEANVKFDLNCDKC